MPRLTERDLKVLNKLGSYEMLSSKQLSKICFPEIDKSTIHRRLRILENEKLIRRSFGLQSRENVWSLSRYGASTIHRDGFIEHINKNNLEHDILLAEVRLALESSGLAKSWTTEQQIRRQTATKHEKDKQSINPDGIMTIRIGDGYKVVAIELELTAKNPSRYRKTFRQYGEMKSIWGVWYFVTNKAIGKKVLAQWRKVNVDTKTPTIGWALVDDVLRTPNRLVLNHFDKQSVIEVPSLKPAHLPAASVGIGRQENISNFNKSELIKNGST